MLQDAWDEIESLYIAPHVTPTVVEQFREFKQKQPFHTKGERAQAHYCAFFLPYDKHSGTIYLGHHKKADDWIPPGGHIEPGETPSMTAIREMREELATTIIKSMLEPFSLSVKNIDRPEQGCMVHYDMWFLVHIPEQPFQYLEKEYYDAGWFPIEEGVAKIKKNPDFAATVAKLLQS